MRTFIGFFVLILTIISGAGVARADNIDLAKGRLTHQGQFSTQTVAVTNNTGALVEAAEIECGFFRQGSLLGSGEASAEHIRPKQTAYIDVISLNSPAADDTTCRVSSAQ
jgi:hypothetical protein